MALTPAQALDAVLAHVRDLWGGLDIDVNNAGVATGGRIDVESISDDHARGVELGFVAFNNEWLQQNTDAAIRHGVA